MDPLLRLTIFMERFRRGRWSRTKLIYALVILVGALTIVAVDKLGYWPDALRSQSGRAHPVFHR